MPAGDSTILYDERYQLMLGAGRINIGAEAIVTNTGYVVVDLSNFTGTWPHAHSAGVICITGLDLEAHIIGTTSALAKIELGFLTDINAASLGATTRAIKTWFLEINTTSVNGAKDIHEHSDYSMQPLRCQASTIGGYLSPDVTNTAVFTEGAAFASAVTTGAECTIGVGDLVLLVTPESATGLDFNLGISYYTQA